MNPPVKYAILGLGNDRMHSPAEFSDRSVFIEECKILANKMIPYATYERRVRKDGRYLWHPCETRFFDTNGGKH
jgi:hypothetical protein